MASLEKQIGPTGPWGHPEVQLLLEGVRTSISKETDSHFCDFPGKGVSRPRVPPVDPRMN